MCKAKALVLLTGCILVLASCGLRGKKEKESFQTPLEIYNEEDFYGQQRRSLDSNIHLNLKLVSYRAQYNNDFVPTISFVVENTGSKTVTSFEISTNLSATKAYYSTCTFRNAFKRTIAPGEIITVDYTLTGDELKETCNDYPVLELVREVCEDGSMNKKY